jgi:hypothetical protein
MVVAISSLPSLELSTPIVGAIVGVIVLFFGRRLFWLCVAAVGFAAGVELAPHFVQEPSPLLALTFALVLGFMGAIIALFLQKIAIAIAGFLAGGKLAVAMAGAFFLQSGQYFWVVFVVGGLVGAIMLLVLFDWALIFLSSVIGAYLIQNLVALPPTGAAILFIVLVALGVVVQASSFRRTQAVLPE